MPRVAEKRENIRISVGPNRLIKPLPPKCKTCPSEASGRNGDGLCHNCRVRKRYKKKRG